MTIKVFRSTDYGAPANTATAGSLISILDGVLVNGYGAQTVSITRNANTASVTIPVAHGLKTGTFVNISGATQTEYNGDFAITVSGSSSFSYTVTGTPVTPATGTISAKVASAGWTKPFSGTNLAGYKQGTGSNGMYLRVNDTGTNTARIKACENMTDINGTVSDFPTDAQASGGLYVGKSSTGTCDWIAIASEKFIYLFLQTNQSSYNRSALFFGDIISNKSGDLFNTMIVAGGNVTNYYNFDLFNLSSVLLQMNSHYIALSHKQIGASVNNGKTSTVNMANSGISGMGISGIPYPSPLDGALHLAPVLVTENNVGMRGTMPNLWCPLHIKPFNHLDMIDGSGQFAGKKFIAVSGGFSTEYQCLIDISNS